MAKTRENGSSQKREPTAAKKPQARKGSRKKQEADAPPVASPIVREYVPAADLDKDALRERARSTCQRIDESQFEFAEAVYAVFEAAAYADWDGKIRNAETKQVEERKYRSFHEYVENELLISGRKGDYMVSIHRWFVIDLADQTVIDKVKGLGWSKVKELINVVDAENVDEWVKKAATMTVSQLAEAARASIQGNPGGERKVVKKTFTLIDDQRDVVENALEHAAGVSGSDKTGNQLTLICQDYLAGAVRPSTKSTKAAYLRVMERTIGLRLIAVDAETRNVVYGGDVYSALGKNEPLSEEEEAGEGVPTFDEGEGEGEGEGIVVDGDDGDEGDDVDDGDGEAGEAA